MYKTILAVAMLSGTAAAQTADLPASYMILDGIKTFCEGGRVMMSAKVAPNGKPFINFKCEEDKYQISLGVEKPTNNNVITGIVFEKFGKLAQ